MDVAILRFCVATTKHGNNFNMTVAIVGTFEEAIYTNIYSTVPYDALNSCESVANV